MSIQILSNEIVNQIAAGEVVERPSHLVKELIENSLDAEATKITVDIADGGRQIRVQDNGRGILSNQLSLALERHATSKINKTDDLWNLQTYGFRGEALASAASVSHLSLQSIHQDEKNPVQIDSHFGRLSEVKPSSLSSGTEIKIKDLFENVPARLKFLKSESSELSQIKSVVRALALAYPNVEFKLSSENELIFYFAAKKNRLDRAKDVLEKKNLFESTNEAGSFKCHVAFASPHDVSRTSKQIWLFVQNRWVQDRALQAAIMDAYRSLLMHGEYPIVALWLECDPTLIDVNIHPTKSQVKFQDSSAAFRIVHQTLRHALEKAPWVSAAVQEKRMAQFQPSIESMKFSDIALGRTQFRQKDFSQDREFNLSNLAQLKIDSTVNFEIEPSSGGGFWSSLNIIGQANLTYIVCQKEDRIVYVDQHAAHERVAFETLMESWNAGRFTIQNFLFPLAIDLSEEKVERLIQHQVQIARIGIELEQLGPITIGIKCAPQIVKEAALPAVFEKLSHELELNGGSFTLEKWIGDLFATMACHSVVRAGQSLSLMEMKELLKSMDQFALSSFCPHGRPVSVEISFLELEKLFGRIN